ncbi:HdeD family acid-resistance protein [Sebaldella sp. S0638]|uniref:HdeD family acid-resistance protein n=1 Tax=Sebaldella sp. S0638 TaxID=2957809 RepID=UPI00209E1EDD|nr:HdeD family acid-resistance protein [Sebaldella sp. S0638]MCP1226369.1 HdeD family acid-resistance protein [Sebaldella sp. S0638]
MIHLNLEQLKNIGQESLKKQRMYYIILGILFAVAGVLCFAKPMVSSWAISVLMGVLFIAGGIILILTTLFFKSLQNIWSLILEILLGIAYIFLGYEFLKNPMVAVLSLAFFIGFMFLIAGIMRIIIAYSNKGYPGMSLFIFTGIVEILLAVFLIISWPENSIALIAAFLGVQFICNSIDYFTVSSYIKKLID